MKTIELTQNQTTIVDDDDYELLSRHKWCISMSENKPYVQSKRKVDGKKTTIYMHRDVVKALAENM